MSGTTDLSIRTLIRDYQTGRLRPADVIRNVHENISRLGERPVWISLNPLPRCLQALDEAAARTPRGPLFGIPFAVKDNIDVEGLPTTAACAEFSYAPRRNAHVVERLVQAGAIVIGKTNLDQFATGLTGTRTPFGIGASIFDSNYISGGSSSGSALAVARGDVSFSLGTDTAGSGRIPAAFNALVGLKPTPGLVSTRGVVPACRTLDCVSIFAHTLDDASLVLEVSAGFDAADPFARDRPLSTRSLAEPPRFGVPDATALEFFGDNESAALYAQYVERLQSLGWLKCRIDFAPLRRAAQLLYEGPWVAERLASIGNFLTRSPDAVNPVVRSIIGGGARYSAVDAFNSMYELAELRQALASIWRSVDAIVLPTAPTHYRIDEVLAEPIALNRNLGTYTNFANLLDLCAIAVPAGFKSTGLPFGVTWFGPAFDDLVLQQIVARASDGADPKLTAAPKGHVWLAVAGAHLSGQPLNGQLVSRHARLVKTTTTAASYRLFALNTTPSKPGLVYSTEATARAVEVEIWELDDATFGNFVAAVPSPMTIGSTTLCDGSVVKGFCCEPHALAGARDITEFGGWRSYLASLGSRA